MNSRISALLIITLLAYSIYISTTSYQQLEQANSFTDDIVIKYNDLVDNYNTLRQEQRSLQANYSYVKSELNQSYYSYNMLLNNYSKTQIIYRPPTANQSIQIWTMQQTVLPNRFIQWNPLDTFINHIEIRTNQTAQFLIMDLNNYANYRANESYIPVYNTTGTYFKTEFHLSQGCAVYVLIIVNNMNSTMAIHPNVTATYAPTPFLTGQCSLP